MYHQKYLKYRQKYLNLKKMIGGSRLAKMPQLCFGTSHIESLNKTLPLALELGYKHIDGAENYGGQTENEKDIYRSKINMAIKDIPRDKLWITWKDDDISEEKIKLIINNLGCEYIDLFLVHHSCGSEKDFIELKKAQDNCLITYYGVSNCENIDDIRRLKVEHNIYANQVQARPPKGKIEHRHSLNPKDFNDFVNECNKLDVKIMLFSTINAVHEGVSNLLDHDSIKYLEYIESVTDNFEFINKYYIQKYILNKDNVLLVGSSQGNGLINTIQDFDHVNTTPLISTKMNSIEESLEKLVLARK